jgi:hypothetical protein
MTKQDRLVTVREGASDDEVLQLMHKHRIEKVLVVNDQLQAARPDHREGHPEGARQSQCGQGFGGTPGASVRPSAPAATPNSALPPWLPRASM